MPDHTYPNPSNIFYNYIILDPRKPGLFNYPNVNRSFKYEPLYVGKGKKRRHKNLYPSERSKLFTRKLNKIRSEGKEPITIILNEQSSEEFAFDQEKKMIAAIGRMDKKTGPLTNHTDGGEGPSGAIVSDKTKQQISNIKKEYWSTITPEEKSRRGKLSNQISPEQKEAWKKKISESHKGLKSSPETKEKKRMANINRYAKIHPLARIIPSTLKKLEIMKMVLVVTPDDHKFIIQDLENCTSITRHNWEKWADQGFLPCSYPKQNTHRGEEYSKQDIAQFLTTVESHLS